MKAQTNKQKYNKSAIMKRAWVYFRQNKFSSFGEALKASWKVEKINVTNIDYNINTIYKKYNTSLINYISYRLNGKLTDAEDIVAETYIKIVEKIHLFDSTKSSLKTWIYNVAYNTMLDHISKQNAAIRNVKQTSYISDYKNDNGLESFEVVDTNNINTLETTELGLEIQRAMNTLNERDKKIAQMILVEDYKYSEVSEYMDIPLNTIKVTVSRIKTKLTKELEQAYKLYA